MNTHKEEKPLAKRGDVIAFKGKVGGKDMKRAIKEYNNTHDLAEPTPPSQIEEEPIYRLIMLWHDYNKHCYSGGTERSPVTFEEFITSSWLLNQLNNTK